jgi:hypothetical protein
VSKTSSLRDALRMHGVLATASSSSKGWLGRLRLAGPVFEAVALRLPIEWLRWVDTRHSRSGLAPNTPCVDYADDHPSDGALAPRRALLKVMRVAPIID